MAIPFDANAAEDSTLNFHIIASIPRLRGY